MKTKNDKSKAAQADGNKPTLVAFLLDRSGSMQDGKAETISGFNSYVKTMREKGEPDMRFTLTQFDSLAVDVLHDCVPLEDVHLLTNTSYEPRGNTPLYDAIGKTIHAAEVAAGHKYKVLFVIQTDGMENASCEYTWDRINSLIKDKENVAHWTFAYIGTGLQGMAQVRSLSAGTVGASNLMSSSHETASKTYQQFAVANCAYARCASNANATAMNFWAAVDPAEPPDVDALKQNVTMTVIQQP